MEKQRTIETVRAEYKAKFKKIMRTTGIVAGSFFLGTAILCLLGGMTKIGSDYGSVVSLFGIVMTIATSIFPAVFVFMVGIIVAVFKTHGLSVEYRNLYKKAFVEPVLEKMFSSYKHDPNEGIPRQVVLETGMIDLGDGYTSNDYIQGEYHGLGFQQADVRIIEEREDSDGHKYNVTVFLGRYIIFEFKKKFEHKTEIVGRGFSNYAVPRVPDFTGKKMRRMPQIELESPDFNKKYKVFAENGSEAFYILDPAFIERIDRLYDAHDGQILLGFSGNKLHIAINDRNDSLEPPSIWKEIDREAEEKKVRDDLQLIVSVADSLKLK